MTYRFEAGQIYRMPTHFGPAPGPRQLPQGLAPDPTARPRRLSVTASFLTEAAALERHLPEGFALAGEPVVTVSVHRMTDIDWLAGRGYTMVHVDWPAAFRGRCDSASGRFLAVMWENLADPIISGRDEIGHPKLFADIEEPVRRDGRVACAAAWMGFRFLDLAVSDLRDAPSNAQAVGDDTLMLKYVPRTGAWGEADIKEVTLTPAVDPGRIVERRETGSASVRFHAGSWSDLPTLHHVVSALAALPVLETRGGTVMHSRGGKAYRDQRVLA